jgi:hypothetical protein
VESPLLIVPSYEALDAYSHRRIIVELPIVHSTTRVNVYGEIQREGSTTKHMKPRLQETETTVMSHFSLLPQL